jgi:hypothetical protein
MTAVRTREGGLAFWYAVLGGIAAWTVHLLTLSSIDRLTCNLGGYAWVMHAVTGVTAAATVAAMVLAYRLFRAGGDDDAAGSVAGRLRFFGTLGLLVGAVNLALILLEGSYVELLPRCGR